MARNPAMRRLVLLSLASGLALPLGAFLIPRIGVTQSPAEPTPIMATPAPPSPPAPPPPPAGLLPVGPRPAIPHLSEEERTAALTIAGADSRVQQLLAHREHSRASVGVWHTPKGLRKIGAVIIFALPEPAAFELDWPLIEYDRAETEFPPYRQVQRHFTLVNVTKLVVSVDLHRGEVVAIGAGPRARRIGP